MKLHEVAIFTDQVDSMSDFYSRLLGAEPVHRGEGIAIFKSGDVSLLIHARYEPASGGLPCENHSCFAVPDLDRALAGLLERGLKIEIPPRVYDWGRSAYLRDPEGNLLEVHESGN